MPLKDLVVYLGNRRSTGVLNLEQGAIRKQIVMIGGDVINASSNEPREYLGQFLINLGQISEEQFHRAYETQRETRIFLGRILVMIGAVREPRSWASSPSAASMPISSSSKAASRRHPMRRPYRVRPSSA